MGQPSELAPYADVQEVHQINSFENGVDELMTSQSTQNNALGSARQGNDRSGNRLSQQIQMLQTRN